MVKRRLPNGHMLTHAPLTEREMEEMGRSMNDLVPVVPTKKALRPKEAPATEQTDDAEGDDTAYEERH